MNPAITSANTPPAPAPAAAEELPVLGYLKLIRGGEFIDELNDAVQEAIDTATELGKPAMVTIKLGISPAGRTVVIEDDINNKLPKAPKDASIFYLDEGNRLTRRDPKQLPFASEAGFTGPAAAQTR